ncbi:MAG: IS1595 family transposase [Bacteroidota bacterium]
MNIVEISKKYGTRAKCYRYLEKLRWGRGKPVCPYCGSKHTVKLKVESFRHHCYNCRKSFSVTVGTIFEDSRLPLPKWFVIAGLITNAKQGISAKEIERNIGVTYKTAWYSAMRVRCAMIDNCNIELENIVEMDESYVGGKPRKRNKKATNEPENKPTVSASSIENKRGRGTRKTPVVGIVERKGKIVLKVIEKLTSKNLMAMLNSFVKTEDATLMTDEYRGYAKMDEIIEHFTINHSEKEYVRGAIHTNTVEGFWNILKNSIKGNYIKVSKKYLPLYLIQSQYLYNHRNFKGDLFEKLIKEALKHDVSDYMEDYKPIKEVKKLVYEKCKKTK